MRNSGQLAPSDRIGHRRQNSTETVGLLTADLLGGHRAATRSTESKIHLDSDFRTRPDPSAHCGLPAQAGALRNGVDHEHHPGHPHQPGVVAAPGLEQDDTGAAFGEAARDRGAARSDDDVVLLGRAGSGHVRGMLNCPSQWSTSCAVVGASVLHSSTC